MHVEVAKPFHSAGLFIADHVGGAIKEVSVVEKTVISSHKALIGVAEDFPLFFSVSLCIFPPIFDVVENHPWFP